jgi:large subunit ribosomal protein L41
MFKATPPLQKMLRRLPLSTKQAGKEYYKGNRVGSMGTIDKWGNFSPDWTKVRTYVFTERGTKDKDSAVLLHLPSESWSSVKDMLTPPQLTPFVAATTEKTVQTNDGHESRPKRLTGEDYLKAWKLQGGKDVFDNGGATTYRNMPQPFEEKAGKA